MIINLIIGVILNLVAVIFVFLPVVHLSDLPYAGQAISDTLTTMVTTWNAFLITFPYAVVAWNVLLLIIVPFELLMLIGKFFFGHRLPAHTN